MSITFPKLNNFLSSIGLIGIVAIGVSIIAPEFALEIFALYLITILILYYSNI